MDFSTPGLPVHHQLPKFTQTHIHWVSDAIQPSHPLSSPSPLPLPLSIFPSVRVFSNESALCIRWSEYWSFSFSFSFIFSSSNECSGLISFRMDWLISLLSKVLSSVFSNTTIWRGWESGSISFLLLIRYVVLSEKLAEPVSFSVKRVYAYACLAETSGLCVSTQLLSRVQLCDPQGL